MGLKWKLVSFSISDHQFILLRFLAKKKSNEEETLVSQFLFTTKRSLVNKSRMDRSSLTVFVRFFSRWASQQNEMWVTFRGRNKLSFEPHNAKFCRVSSEIQALKVKWYYIRLKRAVWSFVWRSVPFYSDSTNDWTPPKHQMAT